ncbi:hypothetical protein [Hydrogenimonas thermophila]|uniref:Uncharacterized protein n=1 Tax=Hydrogenimonas thermophila TaxID=223786 RepID=A0A1I5TRC1_9BACT|nr:hypothetical protein [Hydrogenimonas thermophila]SFP85451.1 hypothetical protein SAMN05216234_1475 [Hydrogenimonas thermophila]
MKKIIGFTIITILSLGFNGCATGTKSLNIYHDKNELSGSTIVHHPDINKISTVDIGENMYEKVKLYSHDTYNVKINQKIDVYTMASGKFTTSRRDLGILKIDKKTGWKSACIVGDSHPYTVCLFDSNNDSKFDKIGSKINGLYGNLNSPIAYSLSKTPPNFGEDSFKYIVLYQGKKGNVIKISFREFINNLARPAFTQDIEYELNSNGSTIIGFKGLRIEVLKATNLDITYKVLKDYD